MFSSNSCCVVGVGFLGTRISGELSRLGLSVNVYDRDIEQLTKLPKVLSRQKEELLQRELIPPTQHLYVNLFENLSDALKDVEFIFEAVVEDVDIKTWLLQKITSSCCSRSIICSNTLDCHVEDILKEATFKERIVGCRFMAPVYCIPLVELTTTKFTSAEVVSRVDKFFRNLGYRVLTRRNEPKHLTSDEVLHYWKEEKKNVRRLIAEQTSNPELNSLARLAARVGFYKVNPATSTSVAKDFQAVSNSQATLVDRAVDFHNEKTLSTVMEDMQRLQIERQQNNGNDTTYLKKTVPVHSPVSAQDEREQNKCRENADVVRNTCLFENKSSCDDHSPEFSSDASIRLAEDDKKILTKTSVETTFDCLTSQNETLITNVQRTYESQVASELHDAINEHNDRGEAGHLAMFQRTSKTLDNGFSRFIKEENEVDINQMISSHNSHSKAGHGGLTTTSAVGKERVDSSECIVCNDYRIDTVLIPCGHMWLCYECAFTLKNSKKHCPACRQSIDNIVRVYTP